MVSVIQDWVSNENISLKQQSLILAALRGCDGQSKDDISKKIVRKIRFTVLNNAAGADTSFMKDTVTLTDVLAFAKERNKYPVHFYIHICHCCEGIGFKHPDKLVRDWFYKAYLIITKSLYLNPETEKEFDARLQDGSTMKLEDFVKRIVEL